MRAENQTILWYYPQPQAFKPFPDAVRKVRGERVDSGEGYPFSAAILLRCEYSPVLWLWNNRYFQAIFRA
jgi:hypothetical protein